MEDIFLARQPIYDRKLELAGYELLYRDDTSDRARFLDGSRASSSVIINAFISLGLENIVGSQPAYIKLSEDFFDQDQLLPMSPEQVVLELDASRLPSKHVMHNLNALASQGYRIALDHFTYRAELSPLLELASMAKLDLNTFGYAGITEQIVRCRRYNLDLLAEKVETHEDMAFCRDLGFDYFQGYFFCKPQLMQGRADPANRAVVMQLLSQLQDPDTGIEDLERIIVQDVALTYKLLRYLNCATYALRREIESVRDALILIGTNAVKKWAVLLLMSSYADNKPRELIGLSMQRARMCELLAPMFHEPGEMAFTVGLFSTLDAVMDTPMEDLLDTISLRTEIKFALLLKEGPLGDLLQQVLHYENGAWESLDTGKISIDSYRQAYLASLQWTEANSAAM